jgi:hypothetical protein
MDFDVDVFVEWIISLNPEYVWLGYNSRPKQVHIPEPSRKKAREFILEIRKHLEIKFKDMRWK